MKFVSLCFSLCLFSALAFGQGANATITGTVADPSGAVIANAPIEVRNIANGQIFTSVSTETGNFTLPQLPVGDYDISITVPGFKRFNHSGFHLAAAQIMREDVVLEVGTAAEAVTVTAEASLLKTESSELVHNVTVSQMNNLPILSVGGNGTSATSGFRDPFALARMIPGVQYTANSEMVINGVPDDTIQIRVEGLTGGNTGGLRQYTGQTQASVDAIQEVAVQTSNYAAEFGTAGGAVFNVVMKSGTNRFNASAYDYGANEALNAHQPYTFVRNRVRRNDYGFTVGGPVKIPKIYDGSNRTFFFWSWEQFLEKSFIATSTATVPIPAYRTGDFNQVLLGNSAQPRLRIGTGSSIRDHLDPLGRTVLNGGLFDPRTTRDVTCNTTAYPGSNCVNGSTYRTRDPFPGNIIPANLFDPVSLKVLALVPQPEGPNFRNGQIGGNYQRPWLTQRVSNLPSLKIDQSIGSRGRMSFYFQNTGTTSQYSSPNGNMEGFPLPITVARGTFIYSRTIRLNYDHTLTPTMLLHLGAGWNHNNFDDSSPIVKELGGYDAVKELGLRGATLNRTFPLLSAGAGNTLTGGMSNVGTGGQGNSFERRPSGNVNLNWVKNNHTFKIGGEWRDERYPARSFTNVAGNYGFNSNSTLQTALQNLPSALTGTNATGFSFASFLMGDISSATLTVTRADGTRKSQWGLFAQDTWKLTRKLTLDYGLRWDYGTYAAEDYGRNANFSFTTPNASAGGHPGAQIFEANCNCNFAANYPYAVGPRLGAAYQINSKTVLRAGFGVVYTATGTASGSSVNDAGTGSAAFGQTFGKLKDGMPTNVQPIWPNFNANAGQVPGTLTGLPTFLDPNAGRPAKQYQWSIGLQREITRNLVVEASYVANRGVWWSAGGLAPFNNLSVGSLAAKGFTDFTNVADGNLLNAQWGNLTTAQRSTLAGRGVYLPYSNYPTNQTVRQSILPFPQYQGGAPAQAPLGKTWYDSLQLNVTQRFQRGLSLNANFTYSKNLSHMGSTDPFNRQLGKDISAANDLPYQFRMTAEYQVPSFAERGLPVLSNKVVAYALSGWGVGWYLQYQSADVIGRPGNNGTNAISRYLGYGPGSAQLRIGPDGQPMSPWSVNWVDRDGNQRTDPIDINCRCFEPTQTVVLNPAAWENVPNGQFANSLSTIRYYRGIRAPNENLNVSRNFRMGERVVLHVRVEFQNILNRTRLPGPSSGNFTTAVQRFAAGTPNAGLNNSGFGVMNPLGGTQGFRSGIFIGRITF